MRITNRCLIMWQSVSLIVFVPFFVPTSRPISPSFGLPRWLRGSFNTPLSLVHLLTDKTRGTQSTLTRKPSETNPPPDVDDPESYRLALFVRLACDNLIPTVFPHPKVRRRPRSRVRKDNPHSAAQQAAAQALAAQAASLASPVPQANVPASGASDPATRPPPAPASSSSALSRRRRRR